MRFACANDNDVTLPMNFFWRKNKMKKFFCLMTALLLLSCSQEKSATELQQSPQTAGAVAVSTPSNFASVNAQGSMELKPADATRNSTMFVVARGFGLSDAKIEWLVNGDKGASGSPFFKTIDTKKGDAVQVKALVQGKEILSNIVRIGNTPPELSRVKIMPETFKPGDTLFIDASGSDLDGDNVTVVYEWTKNGEPAGKGRAIDSPVRRGDKISVKITPFDGEAYGQSITLNREIRNMPPTIVEDKRFNFDGKNFTCQLKAADPDGDVLNYSLKSAPPGMTINPTTGLITWNVPPDFKGKASFTACANDGQGGEAVQTFNVDIGETKR